MATADFEKTRKIEMEVLAQDLPLPVQIDKVAAIRGWFRPRETSAWYAAIQSYLGGKISLDETLHKVAEPIDQAIESDHYNQDFPWTDLWYSVIHSAKRIPHQDTESFDRLVQFLPAFKHRRVAVLRTTGEPAYRGLVDWGLCAREAFNDQPDPAVGCTRPEISAWTSFNYFLARLTQESLEDMSLFGLWALRDGLETMHADGGDDGRCPVTSAQKLDAFVPASAMWVMGAGKALHDKEEDDDPKHRKKHANFDDLKAGETMWPNSARFSGARWAFWKTRFENIAGMGEVDEQVRTLAREAARAMEALDCR